MKGFLFRFDGLRYRVLLNPPTYFSRHYVPYRRLGYVFRGQTSGKQTKSEEISISLPRIAGGEGGGATTTK